jgi:LppX_LprAFG lipoprotein
VRFLVPVLAAIALAASACGGDTVSLDPVAQAADTTAKQQSEHVEFTATGTAADGTRLTMTGSGDFQNDPQLGEMTMSFGSTRGSFSIHEVMKDWTLYMSSSQFSQFLPDGKTWMALDMKKATKALGVDITSLSSQSPDQTLQQLKASGGVTRVGRGRLDGVMTTHYTGAVDLSKVPNGDTIVKLTGVRFEPVEVWVGNRDGLVRRVQMSYSAPAQGSVQMRMDFSRYGVPVYVQVPDEAATFDATKATEKLLHG